MCHLEGYPHGDMVAQVGGEEEAMVLARITLDERVGDGPIRDRRPEIYEELLRPARKP